MFSVIRINRDHDVAYILLRPELHDDRGSVVRSIRVADDIVLDVDANDKLIGIELLNASARLDLDKVSEGTDNLIVGVKEAAEMLRVEKSNFVRDYANKPDFPKPIAELASGRFWLRFDIDRYITNQSGSDKRQPPMFKAGDLVALR